ncbi:MAG TPA: S9 family peptidase [Gemmatimonadales bacterium]|nr:S9 family peptidase [Gemmatimonadales bacterium]
MPRLAVALFLLAPLTLAAQQNPADRQPFTVEDLHRLKAVGDPQLSPDGLWVTYEVSTHDTADDEEVSDLWMTSWDGQNTVRLTATPKASEHTARWSPDGRWLAFLSSRGDSADATQLWLLSRRGGEAEQVTHLATGIEDYAWSPDGSRLVFVITDPDSVEASGIEHLSPLLEVTDLQGNATDQPAWPRHKTPPPIVIDRYYFKEDYTGYVRRKRKHLYLFDLASRKLTQLTQGQSDERLPAWSPDGQYLVFVSKRVGDDPDRRDNWDLYVIQAAAGAVARQLTTFPGPDNHPDWGSRPAWSPDGRYIAYLQGGADSLIYYAMPRLAIVAWGGSSNPVILTPTLDRIVNDPVWSEDAKSLYFRVEDDRAYYLARVPAGGGPVERILDGRRVVSAFTRNRDGRIAALVDSTTRPPEVYAVEGSVLRPLSRQNDSLMAVRQVAPVEEITVRSKDGTVVNGLLVRPIGATGKSPAILQVHGGPVSQFENGFDFYWQLLAAKGYSVIGMNPRGSSGRGEKYALGIWADWGNKDAQDVLAGVDYAVKAGIADSSRLGIGGWSYGAILTNYVIAQDTRFKAATSGAGISNILAGFGTDMYVREYTAELGVPWKNTATYLRLSSPFLHADRIRTPTLFLCGEKDFNVPLLNSEQMYQALRSLGIPTRLIIYPGQNHGLSKPSYQRHRYEQYLAWYGEYLRK